MIRPIATMFCVLLAAATPLAAAPKRSPLPATSIKANADWVAAWGYVVSPPAPGQPTPVPGFSPVGR